MVTGPWSGHSSSTERRSFPSIAIVQGKPVVRRRRKARDLPRETARPPVTIDLAHKPQGRCREGEPGALHICPHASGDDGYVPRRGHQVVLGLNVMFDPKATHLSDTGRPGPESGHRWR